MPVHQIYVKNNRTITASEIEAMTDPTTTVDLSADPTCTRFGSSSSSNMSGSTNDICRICHCEADAANPLLSPCYCSGSLKYVHQTCLQQWLTASETRSCELCKFQFILHTKIKPINEWRRLEMSNVERRRLLCAILFHFVAAMCVIWSLFVLIDRAAEEVQRGHIAWPFWTKLVVVAVGFTGGAVFMYIQCRQYMHLCARWKAHNRIILVQNAPEKVIPLSPPSPVLQTIENRTSSSAVDGTSLHHHHQQQQLIKPSQFNQVEANIENTTSNFHLTQHYDHYNQHHLYHQQQQEQQRQEEQFEDEHVIRIDTPSFDPLEINIQEMLVLDLENRRSRPNKHSVVSLGDEINDTLKETKQQRFKSMPNLSSAGGSSENLLP